MVRRAIELLQYNTGGYLLVIDAGLMRKAAQENKGERTFGQTVELDRAVAVARNYAGAQSFSRFCAINFEDWHVSRCPTSALRGKASSPHKTGFLAAAPPPVICRPASLPIARQRVQSQPLLRTARSPHRLRPTCGRQAGWRRAKVDWLARPGPGLGRHFAVMRRNRWPTTKPDCLQRKE